MFLYDLDVYLENLVESKRYLKKHTSLGAREIGQEPAEPAQNQGSGKKKPNGNKNLKK